MLTLILVVLLFIVLLMLADLINTKKEVMKIRITLLEMKKILEQQTDSKRQ